MALKMFLCPWHDSHRGTGYIKGGPASAGTGVMAGSLGVSRRVLLLNAGMKCIAEKFSETNGTVRFDYLNDDVYYLISFDHTGQYMVAADGPKRPVF